MIIKKLTINFAMLCIIAVFAASCKRKAQLIVRNSSSVEQKDAPVVVEREKVEEKIGRPVALGETLLLLDKQGDTIPFQLDDLDI
ncbi:MAG: hypothetical protein ACOCTU_01660 [Bacteroidota bacterium]